MMVFTMRNSVTQKQGVITCIPKDGKPKQHVKNRRPISLLNTSYKIASAYIASRLKLMLPKVKIKQVLWRADILVKIFDCCMMFCYMLTRWKLLACCLWLILKRRSIVLPGLLFRKHLTFSTIVLISSHGLKPCTRTRVLVCQLIPVGSIFREEWGKEIRAHHIYFWLMLKFAMYDSPKQCN